MAADDTTFGTEMRGYRKDEVDRALQELRARADQGQRGSRRSRPRRVKRLTR